MLQRSQTKSEGKFEVTKTESGEILLTTSHLILTLFEELLQWKLKIKRGNRWDTAQYLAHPAGNQL